MQNNKLTQELLKQLKRIADALEKTNVIEETKIKNTQKLEKLKEKKTALELKDIQEKRNIGKVTNIITKNLESDELL